MLILRNCSIGQEILNLDNFGFGTENLNQEMDSTNYDMQQQLSNATGFTTGIVALSTPAELIPDVERENLFNVDDSDFADLDGIPAEDLIGNINKTTDTFISGYYDKIFPSTTAVVMHSSAMLQTAGGGLVKAVKAEPIDATPPSTTPSMQPTTAANKRGRRSRKQPQVPRDVATEALVAGTLASDQMNEIPGPSAAIRKRHYSIDDSPATPGGTKKIKMHELNPVDNPKAKNARAAFLNREKKKKMLVELESENEVQKVQIEELNQLLQKERFEKEKMRLERDKALEKNLATIGLREQANSIKDFLQAVIPGLRASHGPFDIGFTNIFNDVTQVPSQPVTGNQLVLANGDNEKPSEYFTVHVNMNQRQMLLDYSPSKYL